MKDGCFVLLLLMVAFPRTSGSIYFLNRASPDLMSEASEAARTVFQESGITHYFLSIITDEPMHSKTFAKFTERLDRCSGFGVLQVRAGIDADFMSSQLNQLHLSSKDPHIMIVSNDEQFLWGVLGQLYQENLLAWSTRLVVITKLYLVRLRFLKTILSKSNSMVVIPDNTDRSNIYVYIPYSHRPLKVAGWTNGRGISYMTNYRMFPNKFNKLIDGGHLDAVAEVFPPHTMFVGTGKEEATSSLPFRGPMLIFLDILTSSMNFTFSLRRPPDGAFGYSFPNGTWSGMVGMLVRKEADFAVGPFNLIYARAQVVDYTTPLMIDYGRIIAKKGDTEMNPWGFLMPLTPTVWSCLLVGLLVLMTIAMVMSKLLPTSRLISSQYSLTNYIRVLLGQNSEIASVKHWANSILIATWMIAILIIMESYSGNLRSLLIVRYVPQPFHSVRAVVDDPSITVLWEQNSAYKQLLYKVETGVFKELADAGLKGKINFITTPEFYEAVDSKVSVGDHVLMIEDMTLKILLAYHFSKTGSCYFYLSREHFFPFLLVMTLQKYSPLTRVFNQRIVMITESGIYRHWLEEEFRTSSSCEHAPTSILLMSTLSLYNLWGIFVILLGGYLVSLVIFFLEMSTAHVMKFTS